MREASRKKTKLLNYSAEHSMFAQKRNEEEDEKKVSDQETCFCASRKSC